MDISARLAADLAALTRALDDSHVDLEAELRAFAVDAKTAISSYLGMTITIRLDRQQVSFTVDDRTGTDASDTGPDSATGKGAGLAGAAASLLIPLTTLIGAEAGSALMLYATAPGAFVDLAADLSHTLQLDAGALIVDEHLRGNPDQPKIGAGITGLDELSVINQAVGVLLDRGHTPESARDELERLAALDGGSTLRAAAAIIACLRSN